MDTKIPSTMSLCGTIRKFSLFGFSFLIFGSVIMSGCQEDINEPNFAKPPAKKELYNPKGSSN